MLRKLVSAFADEGTGDFLAPVFEVRTYDPASALRLGTAKLTFAPTRHYVPTYAVRYDANGSSLTYSADTAPDESVVRLARRSELFLCEASLLPGEIEPGTFRGHSSPHEAAQMARDADVGSLMLTHYSDGQTVKEMIAAARSIFKGPISAADDHTRFVVGPVPEAVGDAKLLG